MVGEEGSGVGDESGIDRRLSLAEEVADLGRGLTVGLGIDSEARLLTVCCWETK